MIRAKVLLVGLYDTNTVALAPEVLRAYAERTKAASSFEIRTLNLSIFSQSIDEMAERIAREDAVIIGFSTYIWNVGAVLELARRLDGTIVLGGPQLNEVGPRFFAENPAVDFVVIGEGEETFVELLEYFAGDRELSTIRGIATNGIVTEPRPVLADLDTVPSPYAKILEENPNVEWLAYETSRGCPYLCGFCTWGYSKKMRYHALERVKSDLDVLLSHPTLERIYLCDSSILLDKPRALAILQHVVDKNRKITLRYEFNAEHLDGEIIDLLLKLPENEFNFGVQTINPPALATMRRPFRRNKFEESFHKLARTGQASITMDVIYGLPGDDLEGFAASLEYVMGFAEVGWILTNPLILLPGSEFYRDREKHGIVIRDEESWVVESTATFPREQVLEARRLAFFVSVFFFNRRLREAVRRQAIAEGRRQLDVMDRILSSFSSPLVEGDYPYLIPSVAVDFLARNAAIHRVVALYPAIVAWFDERTAHMHGELLADYEDHFGPQYARLSRFAAEDARRHGWPSVCLEPKVARTAPHRVAS